MTFDEVEYLRTTLEIEGRVAARTLLAAMLEDGVDELLDGREGNEALALLRALEGVARPLVNLEPQIAPDGSEREHAGLEQLLALREAMYARDEMSLEADDPCLMRINLVQAGARMERGDFAEARVLLEQLYLANNGAAAASDPLHLNVMEHLASARRILGDQAGTRELLEQVHAARERVMHADDPELLRAKLNLALALKELGDIDGALALYEHVHSTLKSLLKPDDPLLLKAKLQLANTYLAIDEFEGALALYEYVLAHREGSLSADNPELLSTKLNLSNAYMAIGDVDGALALIEHVHSARERLLPAEHADLLLAKQILSTNRFARWDFVGALALDEYVHSVRKRRLPLDHPKLLDAQLNLALTHAALDDLAAARALAAERGTGLIESVRAALFTAPREARTRARVTIERLAVLRFLVTDAEAPDGTSEESAFIALETARHASNAPYIHQLRNLSGSDAAGARRDLARAQYALGQLIAAGPVSPDALSLAEIADLDDSALETRRIRWDEAESTWRSELQQNGLRRDRAQNELLSLFGEQAVTELAPSRVARALAPNAIAVGITKFDRWTWDAVGKGALTVGSHYFAHVVISEGDVSLVDLGPADELEARIAAWRLAIGAPVDRSGIGGTESKAPSEVAAGRALRSALIDPLLAAAGDSMRVRTLHICLDDALFTAPIDALPLDEGAKTPVRVENDVPRLGDLLTIRIEQSMARIIQPGDDPTTQPSILAAGGIDYDAALDGGPPDSPPVLAFAHLPDLRAGPWNYLFGTQIEVMDLAGQAKRYLDTEAVILSEANVTQEALREAVRGQRYVHIATHGYFLPKTVKSMLDRERSASTGRGKTRDAVSGFAPMTLCGLVLSGVNSASDPVVRFTRQLSAQELSEFDLSACDLAVLSACETNVAITRAGQGIQSLQTALHQAGARTSITSLWKVNDQLTASLMKRFYERLWRNRMGKAEALWAAKCEMRADGLPPRLWAAWVLAGDPD